MRSLYKLAFFLRARDQERNGLHSCMPTMQVDGRDAVVLKSGRAEFKFQIVCGHDWWRLVNVRLLFAAFSSCSPWCCVCGLGKVGFCSYGIPINTYSFFFPPIQKYIHKGQICNCFFRTRERDLWNQSSTDMKKCFVKWQFQSVVLRPKHKDFSTAEPV